MQVIDRISEITYKDFFSKYLLSNRPCIIKNLTHEWRCKADWLTNSGTPDYGFLEYNFGDASVPVADCDTKEYNAQAKVDMKFKDYIKYWEKQDAATDNVKCLYLKDWHFNRSFPEYKAYETPEYFQSDWLNEYCKNEKDDYQFVYMGPKGSWTPFHADVFGSFSWSVNICGKKRWLLIPPGDENKFMDDMKHLEYSVSLDKLSKENVSYFDVIQHAGEAIFVPSGWHHQVWNLEDTISINHNWYNGCNIGHIWKCLLKAAGDVERELSDCKEFKEYEEELQVILQVHHGMNYLEFVKILEYIFERRRKVVKSQNSNCEENWHELFDVTCIKKVCTEMVNCNLPKSIQERIEYLKKEAYRLIMDLKNVQNILL